MLLKDKVATIASARSGAGRFVDMLTDPLESATGILLIEAGCVAP